MTLKRQQSKRWRDGVVPKTETPEPLTKSQLKRRKHQQQTDDAEQEIRDYILNRIVEKSTRS